MAFHQGVGYVLERDQFGGFLDMIVKRNERLTALEFNLFGLEEGDSETVQALENISQVENQLPCAGTSGQDMSTSCVPLTVRVVCVGRSDPATIMEQSSQLVESCEPSAKKSRKKENVVKSKKKASGKRLQMGLDLLVEKQQKLQSLTLPYNLSLDTKQCNLLLLSKLQRVEQQFSGIIKHIKQLKICVH